jgi:hypothetical protein
MIASRSFLSMCDHHIENPESHSIRLPITFPQKDGETVYIHPTALKNFLISYLPFIKFHFILVSGDSDMTVPEDVREEAQQILEHPLLIRWYSQNCTEPQEKLLQLPIGLYFHVMFDIKYGWCSLRQTVEYYQNLLTKLKKTSKKNKCFSNFHFLLDTKYGQDRIDAINLIPSNLIDYQARKMSSEITWKLMSSYKFIVSPHGNGLDCHRTWEALILDCIPIVRTSPLDPMFQGLPVLIVQNWSDITRTLLDNFQPDYSRMEKLSLEYWLKKFKE